jgi:phosphoglycerol transferase MdoB-like AlkP superfamily enzyme
MKNTLSIALKLLLFWLGLNALAKVIFLLVNLPQSLQLDFSTLLNIFKYGFRLDLSMAGYSTLILLLVVLLTSFLSQKISKNVFKLFGYLLIFINSLLVVFDARLYGYWGYKLDPTAFSFFSTPKEAMASVQSSDVIAGVIAFVSLILVSNLFFKLLFRRFQNFKFTWKNFAFHLVVSAVMILPIRGGIGVATIGLSSAYFSSEIYANHAAVNTTWNLLYSYLNQEEGLGVEHLVDDELTQQVMDELYTKRPNVLPPITFDKPVNVVLIVLESFSAGLIENLGGRSNVTPNLNKISKEKWSFTNFYSSGDRSDKGLASLFTGAPGLPASSVLRFPDKLTNLSHLYKNFSTDGYSTSFIYGGNLDFANLRSLFTIVDETTTIEKDQFERTSQFETGKWGIHDQHSFKYLGDFVENQTEPFFTSLYTLSSHQPFDIPPVHINFSGKDGPYLKSAWYTDSCLGAFIDQFSVTDLWNRTLVIITADHAIRQPGEVPAFHPDKFHIPLILTGGVIDQHRVFTNFGSHTDLPYTLQKWLLNKDDDQMIFSKDLFDSAASFANFYYQVGSGMIDSSGCVVYDFRVNKVIFSDLIRGDESDLETKTKCYTRMAAEAFENYQVKRSPAQSEQGK